VDGKSKSKGSFFYILPIIPWLAWIIVVQMDPSLNMCGPKKHLAITISSMLIAFISITLEKVI
jgi:hypothetical protein